MKISSSTLAMIAGATGVLLGAGTLVYVKLRRRKDPAEIERARRLFLNLTGRIASGEIIGLVEPEDSQSTAMLLVYHYAVAGVTYEVAQDVSGLPAIASRAARAVGQNATVKYEVKQPGNSIIVSEDWCGIPGISSRESAGSNAVAIASEAANEP